MSDHTDVAARQAEGEAARPPLGAWLWARLAVLDPFPVALLILALTITARLAVGVPGPGGAG